MVIGIDASQANKPHRTGTEWYAFYVIQEWIRSNAFAVHKVRLYAQEPLQEDFPALPENWEVRILKWPPKIFWSHLRLSFQLLFSKVDLLFVPSHTIPLFHPQKTVTIVHDIGFETNPELYSKNSIVHLRSKILQKIISACVRVVTLGKYGANELDYQRFGLRFALSNAKLIFTVSKFTKNEIEKRFEVHPPLIVAYNGIQHTEFYYPFPVKQIENVRKKYNLSNSYVLSVGRIEKKKNSLAVAQIFQEFISQSKDKRLDLVYIGGDGFESKKVYDFVTSHNLDHRVHFLGWVSQADIAPLLAGASLFAFFSAYEGFGVPLLQSLAVGTPVIANQLDVFKELAGNSATYCDPHNISETASKLGKLLDNQTPEMAESYNKTTLNFTWQTTANVLKKHIENILAKN